MRGESMYVVKSVTRHRNMARPSAHSKLECYAYGKRIKVQNVSRMCTASYLLLKCSGGWIFPIHVAYSAGSRGMKSTPSPVATSMAPMQSGSSAPNAQWK